MEVRPMNERAAASFGIKIYGFLPGVSVPFPRQALGSIDEGIFQILPISIVDQTLRVHVVLICPFKGTRP